MPKIQYQSINMRPWALELVQKAIEIVTEYQRLGYDLTLRQVYYQFVARDLLPQSWVDPTTGSTNNQQSYKKLGDILGNARMAGLMDWTAMVDRTREMNSNSHWTSPENIIDAVVSQYMIDKWEEQDHRPEVWVEKDALEGVVGTICKRLDIPYFSCRGYTSLTSIWANAQRLKAVAAKGATPVILHLGDHDPSGIDMSRDIEERVRLFMGTHGDNLEFVRVALNMDQVEQYNPPENPAKSTDSRFEDYKKKHGDSSWELDALEPTVISALIADKVSTYRNDRMYAKREKQEETEKEQLRLVSDNWDNVVARLEEQGGE
jgi:hypothetical protein